MACYDLLIIGGGINGAGIARDAAGRGLSVLLVEKDDLAAHTSSASTKLIHGGLRYLEYYEFRLVREALIERERLLAIAPHIIRPLTFILPRPEGGRPGWLIRIGLFLYDHLGGRKRLPGSAPVRLAGNAYGAPLRPEVRYGYSYADCRVDDARLVVLNALDAQARGADIATRTTLVSATRQGDRWTATLRDAHGQRQVEAGTLVNAAGPWVADVLGAVGDAPDAPRLVKGSHIVVPRLFDGDHAYLLQNPDGRIVFAIPYQHRFTLVGTTDIPFSGDRDRPAIDDDEVAYLCDSVNRYFARPLQPEDVAWSYSGIRPLHDDGASNAAAVTRDYVLALDEGPGARMLSVFGGKITTYRRLAEHALEKLAPHLPAMGRPWTDEAPLPGGDIADIAAFEAEVLGRWPWLGAPLAARLAGAYGTRLADLIGERQDMAAMGAEFGGGLTAREVDWLVAHEWARTAEDILWRRTKLGLAVDPAGVARLERHLRREEG
ncbi:glycerol-3-phosphate dehydrogenase [Sphingomonas quercus]|uniref:Glycerol-3-phosphate dehydrogenase n=1 Tax=Sphingomonas quercus TaxID=2842451 RepID=A0ABS6BEG8_9SPHN|nr:glycerol-3-phosphate dehydrogenase [Sphingomonas quercus]MBU3076710.1 glycerol-3-phosphate dehydrogenase [Sphingomonas quercus]